MTPLEIIGNQMDFLTKSTKETFRPLTKDEIAYINYAVKEGFLDLSDGEEMLENPSMARDYIAKCDAQQDNENWYYEQEQLKPENYDH